MRRIATLSVIITMICQTALPLRTAQASIFNPTTFTLANGMQVIVIENHRSPVVAHMVWYKIGAADEEVGKSGIAHFFEHLMFKATKNLPAGAFSKIVAEHGGRDNAFTSQDYTAYFQTIPKQHLSTVMQMEADRMHNLILTDDTVYPERDVIIEERKQRIDNEPAAILDEAADAALFVNHPYGTPIIGWQHEIEQLTTQDAVAFYQQHYQPNNAILIVSGAVTADEVRTLAEKYYGSLPNRDGQQTPKPIVRQRPIAPPQQTSTSISLKDARVQQEKWYRAWLVKSENHHKDRMGDEVYDILAEILGGGSTSVLYKKLVREQKIATSIYAYFSDALDYDVFGINAIPAPNVTLEQLEQAIEKEIATFLTTSIDSKQLARIKNAALAQAIFARDSLIGPAMIMGFALALGKSIDDVENYPQKVNAVTENQLRQLAQKLFDDKRQHLTAWLEKKHDN